MLDKIVFFLIQNNVRGVGRFYKLLKGTTSFIGENTCGVKFHLDFLEYIDDKLIKTGDFDKEVLNEIVDRVKPGEVFWDIGANIGIHSLSVKKLKGTVTCIAFEPFFKNFSKLFSNVQLNPLLKIELLNIGLHESEGVHEFYTTPNNSGRTGFLKMRKSSLVNVKAVAISADYLVQNKIVVFPNVIKIDTEGNELAIMCGMKEILKNIDLHTIIFESFTDVEKITQFLFNYGFTVKALDENGNYSAIR